MSRTSRTLRSSQRRTRHHVVAIMVPNMSPLEISVASELFGIEHVVPGRPWYRFSVCTPEPGLVPLVGGLTLDVPHGLELTRRADTIVIPGWGHRLQPPNPEVSAALRAGEARGARLVALCVGAFALAGAGVLAGRRATTHWDAADDFRRAFPLVDLDPNVLYV